MTIWFVTRHTGAIEWAHRKGIKAKQVSHLDVERVKAGDTVIGTLPVSLIARINEKGVAYRHLTIEIPPERRGQELTADDMDKFGARLEGYEARRV